MHFYFKTMYVLIFILLKIVFGNALCPSGSIQGLDGSGNCYKLYLTPKAFADAQSLCFNNGGQLASIKDTFTNNFISSNRTGRPSAFGAQGFDNFFDFFNFFRIFSIFSTIFSNFYKFFFNCFDFFRFFSIFLIFASIHQPLP